MTKPPIDSLVQQLLDIIPPSLSALSNELEKQFYAILKTAFLKMDLVTREEFDVQTRVLKRTREKLEKVEKLLVAFEKKNIQTPVGSKVKVQPKKVSPQKPTQPLKKELNE